jgi:hypothetical protein
MVHSAFFEDRGLVIQMTLFHVLHINQNIDFAWGNMCYIIIHVTPVFECLHLDCVYKTKIKIPSVIRHPYETLVMEMRKMHTF